MTDGEKQEILRTLQEIWEAHKSLLEGVQRMDQQIKKLTERVDALEKKSSNPNDGPPQKSA